MSIVALMIFALLVAVNPSANATPAPRACEEMFTAEIEKDMARYRLTPQLLESAEGSDRELLEALVRLTTKLDLNLTKRIAQSLIESPTPPSTAEILETPFFAAHPELIRPFVTVTYKILTDEFSDRFDRYEIGLLSALIPDQRRIDESEDLANLSESELMQHYGRAQKMLDYIVASATARQALVDLFTPLAHDRKFLRECENYVTVVTEESSYGLMAPASVLATLARLARGKVNRRDATILHTLTSILGARLIAYAVKVDPPDRIRANLKVGGLELTIYYRDFVLRHTEAFFTNILGIRSNLATMMATYQALANGDPLPTAPKLLRQKILANAEPLVFPIVQRLRAQTPTTTPKNESKPEARVSTFEYKPKDLFAPEPRSKKRRSSPDTAITPPPEAAPLPWRRPEIDAERDLHEFTSFVKIPRPIEQLVPLNVYEFWYMRDDHPIRRSVRFAPEVVDWLKEHPAFARPILTALHMGDYRGQMTGIKPVPAWRSKRYDGTIYEVKAHGKYRALLIFHDGRWEVLKVAHKDALARLAQWLEPLDGVTAAPVDSNL